MPRLAPSLSLLLLPTMLVGCAPNDATIKDGKWLGWFASNSSSVVENDDIEGIDDKATIYACNEFVECAIGNYARLEGVTDLPEGASFEELTSFADFRENVESGVYAELGRTASIDPNTLYNCVQGGWDPNNGRFLNTYHGPQVAGDHADERYVGGACAYESEDDGSPTIGDDGRVVYYPDSCGDAEVAAIIDECGPMVETRMKHGFHDWMTLDGFHALQGNIEPWRTEAMINGEGDLQLTIHFRINGEDVYFSWTIDPDFEPEQCVSNESGQAEVLGVDGGDWVGNWSADEDGNKIYYLNAGALQVNANQTWYLPVDWLSGFGHANFIGEEFYSEPPAYGNYYNEFFELAEAENGFFSVPDRNVLDFQDDETLSDAEKAAKWDELAAMQEGWADTLRAYADLWESEMIHGAHAYTGDAGSPDWTFEHKVEDNLWRQPDVFPSGIDGWMELHQSWVRIASNSKIEKGGTAKGDFQIVLTGAETFSRMVVKGEFDIENIREDRWAYPVLEDELRNSDFGSQYCK